MSSGAAWQQKVAAARGAPRRLAGGVTLLIPTLGRPIIAACLGGLLEGTRWPEAVIVANQGPSESIAALVGDLASLGMRARHLHCTGTGRARGLNAGLRLVDTRFVAITDDDCIPAPDWIEQLSRHLANEPATVFTGRVTAAGTSRVISVVSSGSHGVARRPRLTFDRLSGGNCGMPIDAFSKAGLFDEDPCIRYAEDGEWAYRALRAGVPIAYAPDLAVAHIGWRNMDERLSQYRGYACSHGAFFGKHLRRGDLFMVLRATVHFVRALRRWIRGTVRRDAELAQNGRSYATQLFPGIIAGMKSAVRPPTLQCQYKVGKPV